MKKWLLNFSDQIKHVAFSQTYNQALVGPLRLPYEPLQETDNEN